MRLRKSHVEKWYRSYRRFLFGRFSWTPVILTLFVGITGSALAPRGSVASKVFVGLLGLTVFVLFAIVAGFMILGGLFTFYQRRNPGAAIFGLAAGFVFGALLLICAIEGLIKCLQ